MGFLYVFLAKNLIFYRSRDQRFVPFTPARRDIQSLAFHSLADIVLRLMEPS